MTTQRTLEPTPTDDLDAAVAAVAGARAAWLDVGIDQRIELLERLVGDTLGVTEEWGERGRAAKGIDPDSRHAAEEYAYGPLITVIQLRQFQRTLRQIREHGRPRVDLDVLPSGQVTAPVFPVDLLDRVMYPGITARVRFRDGVGVEQARARMGRIYRGRGTTGGGVCAVLGAGNVSAIPASDVLYKLFVEDRVCVLKMSPVNEWAGPILARAFRSLVAPGYLRIVHGDAEVGAELVGHEDVDEIHITGSDRTHDAIVFGPREEGSERKARGEPRLDKPITSELGNVTPIVVVPGPWTDADIAYHGENIASQLVGNAGFNCLTTRVIVTHRDWARRPDLLDAIRTSLDRAERREPYYPGAEDRWAEFVAAHPEAECFGPRGDGEVPWTLIPGVDPQRDDDIVFTTEAFAGVFAEVPLDAPRSVAAFLDEATAFCNQRLWGTLDANLLVHPRSLDDPGIAAAVERAVDGLRYGAIGLNTWVAVAYLLGTPSWGAYPGNDLSDIQSGRGLVHNTFMLEDVEKSVLRGPFRMPLKPFWFHTHEGQAEMTRRGVRLQATGDPRLLPGILWHALRG